MTKFFALSGFLLIPALVAACGAGAHPEKPLDVVQKNMKEDLVWPSPPDPPRVRYLGSFSSSEELHSERSFFGRIGELVFGKSAERLVRPTGVAVRGRLMAIADPGAQSLLLLDLENGELRRVTRGDQGDLVSPVGVAVSAAGDVYLADSFLGMVYVYDHDGSLRGAWGSGDLTRPAAVAVDEQRQRVYVSDAAAHRVAVFDTQGKLVSTVGKRGTGDDEFNWPGYLCVDGGGTVYVVDSLNFRVKVVSPEGESRQSFGRHGDAGGDFARPKGIAVDAGGHLFVVDALFDAVQIFDLKGEFLLVFGRRGTDHGEFWLPTGLAVDEHDRIYVADSYNQRIQIFQFLGG